MKIYVAGHTGLAGSAILRGIKSRKDLSWIGKTHSELDLTNRSEVFRFLELEKPDAVIMAAAKVGGILDNKKYPVGYLSENIQISTNVLDGSHAANVSRLIFLGSSCVYPKFARQPIKEEALLTGPLEETNEPYALAKIAGIKLVESYRRQFNRNWISVMPTNLYGPGDNFDPASSHVLPGLLQKIHSAKLLSQHEVELWGTGRPLREFLYSDDLAAAVLLLLQSRVSQSLVNIGSGEDISIHDLAGKISDLVGYTGKITWNSDYPDGTPKKTLDSSLLRDMGWKPKITLENGLRFVYQDFIAKKE